MAIIQDLPFPAVSPLLLENGELHPAWHEFFYALWLRTGGNLEEEIPEEGPVTSVNETNGLVLTSGTLEFNPAALDHDSLLNWEASRHVDHAQIDVIAGLGLLGGGPITTDVTLQAKGGTGISIDSSGISLDITKLTEATPASADHIAIYDADAGAHRKTTLATLLSAGASALNDLSDVELTSPQHNDVLVFISAEYDLVLSGDMNSGSDQLLLSGDMQSGTDVLLLSGDEFSTAGGGLWQNIPFASLPL